IGSSEPSFERDPRVIVAQDLLEGEPLDGHGPGAPLIEADAVPGPRPAKFMSAPSLVMVNIVLRITPGPTARRNWLAPISWVRPPSSSSRTVTARPHAVTRPGSIATSPVVYTPRRRTSASMVERDSRAVHCVPGSSSA